MDALGGYSSGSEEGESDVEQPEVVEVLRDDSRAKKNSSVVNPRVVGLVPRQLRGLGQRVESRETEATIELRKVKDLGGGDLVCEDLSSTAVGVALGLDGEKKEKLTEDSQGTTTSTPQNLLDRMKRDLEETEEGDPSKKQKTGDVHTVDVHEVDMAEMYKSNAEKIKDGSLKETKRPLRYYGKGNNNLGDIIAFTEKHKAELGDQKHS